MVVWDLPCGRHDERFRAVACGTEQVPSQPIARERRKRTLDFERTFAYLPDPVSDTYFIEGQNAGGVSNIRRRARVRHSISRSVPGFLAAIKSSVLAAPDGARRPCSHSWSVRTDTPSIVEFHAVVKQLRRLDPGIARTFANATFMAHAPRDKATAHFARFAQLMMRFRRDVRFVRTVARASFRAPDPIKAAEGFIADYDAVVAQLTGEGVEPSIARSLAGIASVGAEPSATDRRLVENFDTVLSLAKKTHPGVARSIALSACRASDPLETARLYMKNYDRIVRAISRADARRAHRVAAQVPRRTGVSNQQSDALGEAVLG